MKRLVALAVALAASAVSVHAADLPQVLQPTPLVLPAETGWSGFYAGVFGGVGHSRDYFDHDGDEFTVCDLLCDGTTDLDLNGGGGIVGGQIGYDAQFDSLVFGAMADLALTSLDATLEVNGDDVTSHLEWVGTVRGRVGYAMDDLLLYVHGGAAFGKTNQTYNINGTSGDLFDTENDIKVGYVVGAGLEYRLSDSISLKTEYGYYNLGRDELGNDNGFEDLSFQAVTVGVSFHF